MKNMKISLAIALALASATAGTAMAATKAEAAPVVAMASQDEINAVRAQLQALAERLQKLEQSNQDLAHENAALKAQGDKLATVQADGEKSRDSQSDAIAKTAAKAASSDWATRIKWNGDFRFRDERISRDLRTDQVRDRLRARVGFTAKVNDTMSVGARLATGADDPRSTNQTMGAADTGMGRRTIALDQYYLNWKALDGLNVIGGRMPYPYWRSGQSLINDGDINPEGLAFNYQHGMFFANAYSFWMSERAAANFNPTTGVASSIGTDKQGTLYSGLQLGLKWAIDADTTLTAAAMYTDLGAGKGRIPYWFSGGSIPTTTTTTAVASACAVLPCTPTVTVTNTTVNDINKIIVAANGNSTDSAGGLLYDFHVMQVNFELASKIQGLPVSLWGDFAKNSGAHNGLNKAYTAGFMIGKASNPNTWEIGYAYEKLQKDAYFGAFVDSDFGAGATDTKGSIFRLGYAPAKNWTINATYFMNKLNNSGLSNVALQSSSLHMQDENYKRLQIDIGVKY